MHKLQALLTTWEERGVTVHRSNERLTFSNAVKKNDGGRDAAGTATHRRAAARWCATVPQTPINATNLKLGTPKDRLPQVEGKADGQGGQ